MFRKLDLSIYSSNANSLLNHPNLRLIKMDINCSFETGYTTAEMRFEPCEKRPLRFKRYLRRFLVDEQENEDLDELLKNKDIRVIKHHVFPTESGTVVVIDYHMKNRKAGRS